MRPRLYLISIIVAIVVSLFTYGKLDIFQETQINFLNKELILNSENFYLTEKLYFLYNLLHYKYKV